MLCILRDKSFLVCMTREIKDRDKNVCSMCRVISSF